MKVLMADGGTIGIKHDPQREDMGGGGVQYTHQRFLIRSSLKK